MKELFYTAIDVACIINNFDFTESFSAELIYKLWNEEKNFLADLPGEKEIELFGIKILLVHGSPRKNNENIYPNLPIGQVEEMIKDTDANIIFCGHTHMPCGYQTNTNQTVVNVGSIGRPFSEKPDSCYAILEINEATQKIHFPSSIDEFERARRRISFEELLKRSDFLTLHAPLTEQTKRIINKESLS